MYTNVKVGISDTQKRKLKKALSDGTQLSLRLSHADLAGEDLIAVTQSQLNNLKQAKETGKGVTIKLSKTQVAHNMKVRGGFLPLLASLASQAVSFLTGTVLPASGVGALSGLASTGVQKIMGNGLFLKKGGGVCEIDTDGKRLLLEPVKGNVLAKKWRWLVFEKTRKSVRRQRIVVRSKQSFQKHTYPRYDTVEFKKKPTHAIRQNCVQNCV